MLFLRVHSILLISSRSRVPKYIEFFSRFISVPRSLRSSPCELPSVHGSKLEKSETKTKIVLACHALQRPLQKHPLGLLGSGGTGELGGGGEDAVVGSGHAGRTASKSGHSCPCQNCKRWPHAEKDWKRSFVETSLMSPRRPTRSRD